MSSHGDVGIRAAARRDLRKYDNPENGKNKYFQDKSYLHSLTIKYNMQEEALRQWANSIKYGGSRK